MSCLFNAVFIWSLNWSLLSITMPRYENFVTNSNRTPLILTSIDSFSSYTLLLKYIHFVLSKFNVSLLKQNQSLNLSTSSTICSPHFSTQSYVMLCYICYVTLCYVTLCYVSYIHKYNVQVSWVIKSRSTAQKKSNPACFVLLLTSLRGIVGSMGSLPL